MAEQLTGRKVAFLMTDGFEQVEFTEPWDALKDAGANVILVSPVEGSVFGMNSSDTTSGPCALRGLTISNGRRRR